MSYTLDCYITHVLIYSNTIFKKRTVLTARRRRIRPSSWTMSSRRLDWSPAIRRSSSSRRCRRPRSSAIRTGLRVDTPATPPRLRATCACFSCSSRRRRISHIISLKIHICTICQVNKIFKNVIMIRLSKWQVTGWALSTVQMSEVRKRTIKWEEMWFKTTAEDEERGAAVICDRLQFHRRVAAQ